MIPVFTSQAAIIDETGVHIPTYERVLEIEKEQTRNIYGADIYLEPDSQDGQRVAILAAAKNDFNQALVAGINCFSPATAVGAGLSSVVKINGIQRKIASFSSVDLRIIGQVGTTILNGQARDVLNQIWNLPAMVTIPPAGEITVTALAAQIGFISAQANTVNQIATPTNGWQTVNNLAPAAEGLPVETDAQLRARQKISTARPSRTVLDGTKGAVASIVGVSRSRGYENDKNVTDADGIPPHSISLVVEGGNAQEIADTIALYKTPGTGTYGTTTVTVTDQYGVPIDINFFRPTEVLIDVYLTIEALAGYTTVIGDIVKQAIVDYINNLGIGEKVRLTKLYIPANLCCAFYGETFEITSLLVAENPGSPSSVDIPIAFNEVATSTINNIFLTVT